MHTFKNRLKGKDVEALFIHVDSSLIVTVILIKKRYLNGLKFKPLILGAWAMWGPMCRSLICINIDRSDPHEAHKYHCVAPVVKGCRCALVLEPLDLDPSPYMYIHVHTCTSYMYIHILTANYSMLTILMLFSGYSFTYEFKKIHKINKSIMRKTDLKIFLQFLWS